MIATAAVIGDVIASRRQPDRPLLHARLTAALSAVNAALPPLRRLRITVGDEFQGSWPTVPEAVGAVVALRLSLLPQIDTRFGIGWGDAGLLDQELLIEDGPAWWRARNAIVEAKRLGEQARTAAVRARFHDHDASTETTAAYRGPDGAPLAQLLNGTLGLLDQRLGALSATSLQLLRSSREGKTQQEIAQELGITQSAVSQRFQRDSLWVLRDFLHALGSAGPATTPVLAEAPGAGES